MMSPHLQAMLVSLRELKTSDVRRYVRMGDLQRALMALGAAEALEEFERTVKFAEEATARSATVENAPLGRKHPGRESAFRSHNLNKVESKGAVNG